MALMIGEYKLSFTAKHLANRASWQRIGDVNPLWCLDRIKP
jgi:hypothetical protein